MIVHESLDQRYLEFIARTHDLFKQFPQLEPLRHFVFKDLLVQRRSLGILGLARQWIRPFARRNSSHGVMNCSDVLIWIESGREVIVEALLPIYRELVLHGISTQLVSFGGPVGLPASTYHFCPRPAMRVPHWAISAWEALCHSCPQFQAYWLKLSFSYACADVQALFDGLQGVLDVIRPKIVLCASTNLPGGAALAIASRERGAATMLLQHGIAQAFYTPLVTDYMITWGHSSNDALTALNVKQDKLIALGSPRHDSMKPAASANAREQFLRTLSLPDKHTFVFFSNGNDLIRNGHAPNECARWLEEAALQNKSDLNVVVRLHPNEDGSLYRRSRALYVTKNHPDLSTTLEGCDSVGSLCSTCLYDALLYDKPVFQFYADGWADLADNWKKGLAIRIASPAQLCQVLKELSHDGERSLARTPELQNKAKEVFANHGCASKVVSEYLIQRL